MPAETDARIGSRMAAIVVALSGVCALSACQEQAPVEEVIRPVRTVIARAGAAERIRSFSGVAEAGQESSLSFKVAGTVSRVEVAVGAEVTTGRLLAALDASDYELRVREAEAAALQAGAQARSAQSEYERVRSLYENQNASKSDLDRARGQAESAAAAAEVAQRRVDQARRQLSYTRLTAPRNGLISQVLVDPGENVSAGQRIAVLSAGDRVEVRVAVPEVLISLIEPGASVSVRLDALPDRTFGARVTEVGVTASAGTTYPVEVTLDTAEPSIRPGMAARVDFTLPTADSSRAFLLPSVSVGEDADGRFVYVVEPAGDGVGIVRRRPVEVGDLRAQGIEVVAGLQGGEQVITAGTRRVSDGLTVKLEPVRLDPDKLDPVKLDSGGDAAK